MSSFSLIKLNIFSSLFSFNILELLDDGISIKNNEYEKIIQYAIHGMFKKKTDNQEQFLIDLYTKYGICNLTHLIQLLKTNKQQHDTNAREWCVKYAM